nr:MAG TPA: hypothetical protein [Caudoviricetes sp.]DAT56651.1 MAG TPA: hypothetical protein [Caudoviricetes sp.]
MCEFYNELKKLTNEITAYSDKMKSLAQEIIDYNLTDNEKKSIIGELKELTSYSGEKSQKINDLFKK